MTTKLKRLWHEHKLMLIGFVLVSILTLLFFMRTVIGAVYFNNNKDRPIEPWMPIGFIAKSYQVPSEVLVQAVGIPLDKSILRQLRRVSQETDIPYDRLVEILMETIKEFRASEQPRND